MSDGVWEALKLRLGAGRQALSWIRGQLQIGGLELE